LRHFSIPASEDDLDNLGVAENSSTRGKYAIAAAMFIGMILYLMRGSRPDLAVFASVLGSYVSKWNEPCDKALARCCGYLDGHGDFGLVFVGDERDLLKIISDTLVDSDHAAHKADSISVNGACSFVRGDNLTNALLGYFATRMTLASTSSGEAETVAGSIALRRLALPLSGIVEECLESAQVIMRLRGDASVQERCLLSGRSKTLRYIRKVHRVSLHFCAQILALPGHEYEHVPSGDNTSDILTKPLPQDAHWLHCKNLGLADAKVAHICQRTLLS